MYTERFFQEGLAHASYLIGTDGDAAAVVDPRRDVDDYIAAAERHNSRIVAVFETHPHADFVSGHVELARRTGATIYISEKAAAQYPHHGLAHGNVVPVGPIQVTALDTPGHSPDSLSFYAKDGAEAGVVFTGDVLFVGDVGRPDLRDATADPRVMAVALYDSLHRVLFALPQDTVVYPAHGSGSLCGRQIGGAPQSTIGAEKRTNWAASFADRGRFTTAMLSNLPDRPAYFSYDVQRNLAGAPPLGEVTRPRQLGTADLAPLAARAAAGEATSPVLLDTRPSDAYTEGHLAGSLNIGIGSAMFSTWAGFFVTPGAPVVLIVDAPEAAERAWLELARIGYDAIAGYAVADPAAWRSAGLDVRETRQIESCDVEPWLREKGRVLDVRTPGEWQEGHISGAESAPLPELPRIAPQLVGASAGPVATMCGSGYRSSLAVSLLERAGIADVANVRGGWAAWTKRPCAEPDARDVLHTGTSRDLAAAA